MKNPHDVIIRPHNTEKSVKLSYGDPLATDESTIKRTYTFVVANTANKIEIKQALESIYNTGRKKDDLVTILSVRTMNVRGKMRRVGRGKKGKTPDFKKALVTLAPGQVLEDFGV